ncbi:DUF742 domain-containing protein [Mycobacterium sp. CBMA293]|uniref:DUF742 domain-containing protein n=1 Tax=unclassified Mycolicibacterium TaxID=2636767 RepID=UPI0012DF7014|nr:MULTISPECIES: DUF742 domain-containing protein [unclassified Mycolicibacterium]MUL48290.1 DUF742 domain-containing protein [Mycolicibacterium sp. CBMA 360]MUL57543.1 DUF742 domain-containing protein [Mycolicibacterium sp. CBMA 335]MUL70583.1 DUF742 domain-containing protein [Mycolicibacterium sp. CBMA 311]MUL92631.1 DUF742 domain-containing protein [Mycolicibacterium sp. CBMA 230]MUM08356.1 hypothetical protein [Mycolicibacterium sp. CBMA 213]
MEPTSDAWEAAFRAEQPSLVRPYMLTSGRTSTEIELPLEAPIYPLEAAPASSWPGNDVRGEILKLGSTRPSVAEVAAKLAIPLGVARVLIGDLVTQGYLQVHATLGTTASVDDRRDLIGRTLRGLRAL